MLMDWAGTRVYHYGKSIFEENRVLSVEYEHPVVRGTLDHGPRGLQCRFELFNDGSVDNQCPCRDSRERGIICPHVIAVAMELIRRNTDPERDLKAQEEKRRAERLEKIDESAYLERVSSPVDEPTISGSLQLTLPENWRDLVTTGKVPLTCRMAWNGHTELLEDVPQDLLFLVSEKDDNILFVLEDICEGPARGQLDLTIRDFINVLELCQGREIQQAGQDQPLHVNSIPMTSILNLDLDRENGELILMIHTELPFMDERTFPTYIISHKRGWIFDAHHFWPLKNLLPEPMHGIYLQPVYVERPSVPHFIRQELPGIEEHIQVVSEISEDLFDIIPATPRFKLLVRGSPASLSATLYAVYRGMELVAGKPEPNSGFSLPDVDDLMLYYVRNIPGELEALNELAAIGLTGDRGDHLSSVVGCDKVLNFLGSSIPRVRRMGWKVELEGRIEPFMDELDYALPVVKVKQPASGSKWFEVGFDFENAEGESLSQRDIQRALMKGDSFIERDGRSILIDADAIQTARDVFNDCGSTEGSEAGTFRMGSIYGAYVQSSLDALDGVDVEAPPAWQQASRIHNRADQVKPVPIANELEKILRPYQKDGVYWLEFLQRNGFGGILADEMGLGKTVQSLTWIQNYFRQAPEATPALIVCPTSLVENWAEEAAKFTPDLHVLIMSGADRHKMWDQLLDHQIVVTSYALIRRDIEKYIETEFSIIILDEAQHIKNRSTQNALAAKKLKARHRLVLTGTPIENSVSDLWSIMDFLMPGYLGSHRVFRENYELPISKGSSDGESAQHKLKRKLHPFLLRRLKKDVAKDLPPKIERVISCTLSKDQQLVYNQLLQASRRKISDIVEQKGFNHARMEILKVLLRLRQICCHLDLLKLDNVKSTHPSAKMELFFELIDEALDGGHRVLVFSQFTSMLRILRKELEKQNRPYCYLDGSTKDRLSIVKEFNTNHTIPVFLISLKAGGTGLNLTGADMVIHFDPWWNPAVENQATDRAYRIGQKRTVYSVKMITRGTVEDKVLAMQKKKQQVIDATLTRDDQVMQKLTWEDVQDLLSV
jgi:superfamily II DNA or RNA helicase